MLRRRWSSSPWAPGESQLDAARPELVQHVFLFGEKEDCLAHLAGTLALLDATEVDARDFRYRIADALGIGNAARDDKELVLVGHTALDGLDAVLDGLDDELDALRLRQAQRRHLEAIGRGVVIGDEDAVGSDGAHPRESDLPVQQPVVDAKELDHVVVLSGLPRAKGSLPREAMR